MRKLTFAISILIVVLPVALLAQVRPVYDRGTTGLLQALKRLNTSASVLMIGAHPDDEDTALLAYLARGESARTAYLSLTRGDGGQNIIGPELGEALGVIRTEELLQARRLDGAEQFFTRAYDYGFSKTLAEAKSKWDEKLVLCDAVRVIRSFRPLVVVSQFTGTPADGHGQHQFAGYLAPIAVKAAADQSQCSGAGPTWTVKKFYARHRGGGELRLRVNTGRYDPSLGRSYFEIAMEARSQHKSQEQGVLELRGDQFSSLNLQGSEAKESRIFDGLDVSIRGMTNVDGPDAPRLPRLNEIQASIESAIKEIDIQTPAKILPDLVKGYALAVSGESTTGSPAGKTFFRDKRRQFAEAIALAGGVQLDALADRETVVPGESVTIGVKGYSASEDAVKIADLQLVAPSGWTITRAATLPTSNSPAFVSREVGDAAAFYTVTPPAARQATQPYWLVEPRDGDLFRWNSDPESNTLPFQMRDLRLSATLDVEGTKVTVERPVEFRFADDVRGEIRRNVDVVPRVTVELDQSLLIIPFSPKPQKRQLVLTVTNHSKQAVYGTIALNFNGAAGWQYTASSKTFSLGRPGERSAITLEVIIPARAIAGSYPISANAMIGETLATSTMRTVAYPHIQTHRFYRRAEADARVIDLKTTPVKVGYIVGSGDRVPEAIRQMGFDIEIISERDLAGASPSKFDVIVVGIRVYQVRPDVVANNTRLLDYVRAGGTLIVQYQLPGYAQPALALTPFPIQMGPRVSDENAPVKILEPAHSIFNFPNKITDADFVGWVQERNLYNFTNLGKDYTPLLESHDPGEAENNGGLVIARVGKGNYVYCSYSLFRQLPAGVGGAYRLLANMLSLPRAK